MKRLGIQSITALSLLALSSSVFAVSLPEFDSYHRPASAFQISTNSIDLARYTQSHEYTFGVGVEPYSYSGPSNTSKIGFHVFGRKNFPVCEQFVTGIGLNAGTTVGKKDGQHINASYTASNYVTLEYAAVPYFLVGATLNTVAYETEKVAGNRTTNWKALTGAGLQISYLF